MSVDALAPPYRGIAEWRLNQELRGHVRRDSARSILEGRMCRNRKGRKGSDDCTGRAGRLRVGRVG